MEAGFLVALIIVVTSFLLIAGTLTRWISKTTDKEAEWLCHDSIALRMNTALQVNNGPGSDDEKLELIKTNLKTVPTLCRTIDKKFSGDREEIKQQIADKIARCWWMFGEGRYEELLHGSQFEVLPDLFGSSNSFARCHTCYTVLINEEDLGRDESGRSAPITYDELVRYLNTRSLSEFGPRGTTYLNYLSNEGRGLFGTVLSSGIKPKHAYAISILPKTVEREQTNWAFWGGLAVTTGTIVVAAGCTYVTGGLCAPLLLGAVGKAGALTLATSLTYELVQGEYRPSPGTPGVPSTNAQIPIEDIFSDQSRQVTQIYLTDLEYAEKFCGSEDIAGK